jgi:2-oxoisovalerate dehydrogenase E1 component
MDEQDHAQLELIEDLRLAHVSRAIDDREIILAKQGRVLFQVSSAGHEAFLLALAHSLRPGSDWFFPYYRDRALLLALGMSPLDMLLHSVGAGDDPSSGGRQLPSHWASQGLHIPPLSSPTGSQCLPAVGCAEAGRYIAKHPRLRLPANVDEITVCSLGDGTTAEGEFWESLEAACTMQLPVLFLIADNGYSHSVRTDECVPGHITTLVRGFPGLHIVDVDGTDYFAVREIADDIVGSVRSGLGPALIRATVTRPYSHSSVDSQQRYRLPQDLEHERQRDPITRFEGRLIDLGILTRQDCDEIRDDATRIVKEAAEQAMAARRPDVTTLLDNVVDPPEIMEHETLRRGRGAAVNLITATTRALAETLRTDETARLFGEDVADAPEDVVALVDGKGGVFGVTHGLQREFGFDRCYNTPVAEASVVGRAIGQAYRGLHPLPEIQFLDFIWPAMQQIRSEAATVRWRSNGTFRCPMVLRVPVGGYAGGGSGIWHSQSGESFFAHIPGLLIAFPSTVPDTVGLLRSAMAAQDPVLFFEHKHLLRQAHLAAPYPDDDYRVPFGRARVVEAGSDLTIVTYGATVHLAQTVARELNEQGRSIEVIDLRTISPWDKECVGNSVAKTSRVMVLHEDTLTGGFGAEIAAWIGQELFGHLDAPVTRVAAKDAHAPYETSLEYAFYPQTHDIREAAEFLLAY